MAATLSRLVTKRDQIDEAAGRELRQFVQEFSGLGDRLRGELIAEIDRRTASQNGWTFVMLSPEQNNQVVQWLFANSSRPQAAVKLWALLFTALRTDTGEIMLTRLELAETLNLEEENVSRIMTELEKFGAISRRRQRVGGLRGPGMVRYFMNPRVATGLTGAAREKAQAKAPVLATNPPLLTLMEGGKT